MNKYMHTLSSKFIRNTKGEFSWKQVHFLQMNLKVKIVQSFGTSLVVQWLKLRAPNAGGPGLIPGQGTRSHATTKDPARGNEDPSCCNSEPVQPNK